MFNSFLLLIRISIKTRTQLLLEVIMLTKQLEIYQRSDPKLKITGSDRIFFSIIKDIFSNWRDRMFIVKPDTVIKWHKKAFRIYWQWKSKPKNGRPMINKEIIFQPGEVRQLNHLQTQRRLKSTKSGSSCGSRVRIPKRRNMVCLRT